MGVGGVGWGGVGGGGMLPAAHRSEHLLHHLGVSEEVLGHAGDGVGGDLLRGRGAG